jgi:hypothetical protein
MRIDTNSLSIIQTEDPAIVVVTGRATEDGETTTNDKKTWYSFDIRWNINRPAKEFGSAVEQIVNDKKPPAALTNLKTSLTSANKKILVDMTGEEPVQEIPS